MHACLPLGCLVFAVMGHFLVSTHMILEDALPDRKTTSNPLTPVNVSDSPPIVIVELPRAMTKNKKAKKQIKQNKLSVKKHPPPPPNCVPLWGSCKSPDNVCCEYCAFCQCRLFKTVCYCRMGNPRC